MTFAQMSFPFHSSSPSYGCFFENRKKDETIVSQLADKLFFMNTLDSSFFSLTSPYLWLFLLIIGWFLFKLRIRLQLSKAKHASLHGHAKFSRRAAKLIPFFAYDEYKFFHSDGAPDDVVKQREAGFKRLKYGLPATSPKSVKLVESLYDGVSDAEFTSNYRVPFPYRDYVKKHLKMGVVADQTKGVQIKDLDGHWFYDLTGAYGVNVFGYDFYKSCMATAWEKVKDFGPVLGPYHPLIKTNVARLKTISGLDEVSFHMSGTEAVMQAVSMARYHTGKTHLVKFCGAYHGWWDGVHTGVGGHRQTDDVYMLKDQSSDTLRVLETRTDIACILVNPLQGLHPNANASSDGALIGSDRKAHFNRQTYTLWLQQLRDVCTRKGIVLIFDEVFTGFRLAYGGAQEFYQVQADLVTYGKTLGGGMPVGVLCGKHALMKRFKAHQPANISFARGTFNAHPYVMACMDEFLSRISTKPYQSMYQAADAVWESRVSLMNARLLEAGLPVRIEHLSSILTVVYTQPSRYNWMYQYYLRQAGIWLSWVGTGRLIMSYNFSDAEFDDVVQRFVEAGSQMKADGWWWQSEQLTQAAIKKWMKRDILQTHFPRLARLWS